MFPDSLPAFAPHSLVGRESAFHLHCKQSLDAWVTQKTEGKLKRIVLRYLIRKIYDLTEEFSGDFRLIEFGTFTDLDVVRAICRQKNEESKHAKEGDEGYGCVWEVKESPVNRILPYSNVRFGVAEYSGTDIDSHMRRRNPNDLIDSKTIEAALKTTSDKIDEGILLMSGKISANSNGNSRAAKV